MKLVDLTKTELLELVDSAEYYPSVTEADDKAYILAYLDDEACSISKDEQETFLKRKELLNKLSFDFKGVATKWDSKRYEFIIKFGRFRFSYYGSIDDYNNGKKSLTDDELLFAYRCIIGDACSYLEANKEKGTFLSDFGYIDEAMIGQYDKRYAQEVLSIDEYKQYEIGVDAFKGCKNTFTRLNKSDDEIYNIMNELQELGVE